MKVLVDSSVWIDFLKSRDTAQTRVFEQLIANREDICICGFVLTEVLQGIREEKEYVRVKKGLDVLVYLDDDKSTYEFAATIYRELRRKGVTIRNSVDCLIAAIVVQHGVKFLESDRDYEFIDQHYPLNRIK